MLLGSILSFWIRRQLRPLERMTEEVGALTGARKGEAITQSDNDPREVRSLAMQFNGLLKKQDDSREAEQRKRREEDEDLQKTKNVVKTMEGALETETINFGGFLHELMHYIRSMQPKELQTIASKEQRELNTDIDKLHSKIADRLNALRGGSNVEESAITDVKVVVGRLFAMNPHTKIIPIVNSIRNHYPEKGVAADWFLLRYDLSSVESREEKIELCVRMKEELLQELIVELIRNAAKAAKARICVTIGVEEQMVRMLIENDGKRFPTKGRKRLLIWGEEATQRREGYGIGLPYVRRTACNHFGDLMLQDSDEFGGGRVVMELPLYGRRAGHPPGSL